MVDLRRVLPALLGALLTAAAFTEPSVVQAFPAAPMEADSRPCFELLPDPAISLYCGHRRYHGHGRGYGYGYDGYRIVCERARPGAVSWALAHLPPGATLVLVAILVVVIARRNGLGAGTGI